MEKIKLIELVSVAISVQKLIFVFSRTLIRKADAKIQ